MSWTNKYITQNPIDVYSKMLSHRKSGNAKGRSIGFTKLNEHISLKPGVPLFMGGAPFSGKSELALEIVINDIRFNKKRWLIVSPETGNTIELYAQIVEKLIGDGSKYYENYGGQPNKYAMKDESLRKAMTFLNNHLRTIDPNDEWKKYGDDLHMTMTNLFDVIDREEEQLGFKFDGILIDPFNEMDVDDSKKIHQQVRDDLDTLIVYGKKSEKVIILTNHTNDVRGFIRKDVNNESYMYYPPARPEDWAFGQQWFRKAYQLVTVYRPQVQTIELMADAQGDWTQANPYQHAMENGHNISVIKIQKSKPKGIGKVGEAFLFYDVLRQRYYELDENGGKHYA